MNEPESELTDAELDAVVGGSAHPPVYEIPSVDLVGPFVDEHVDIR